MLSAASFRAMGVVNTVAVEDPSMLAAAMAVAVAEVDAIDRACSRFRADSDLSRLNRATGRARVPLSPLLEEAIAAALDAARITGGLVDPTVGWSVERIGYTVSFGRLAAAGPPIELEVRRPAGWRAVDLDPVTHTIGIPDGVVLDLGASGKAWAADRAAGAVAAALGVGVLVECGGDVAVRGTAPEAGWPVRVAASVGADEWQDVTIRDGGLATSGTSRRWRRGGLEMHDIIDPATGLPAVTPWTMVTVAAATCVEANAASTAALIKGDGAAEWLDGLGLPARLVREDGAVFVAGGWSMAA